MKAAAFASAKGGSRKRALENRTFFSWFCDNGDPSGDDIAEVIKDDMWPNPLQYFLVPDIEVENGGDEDDDDEDDDEDVEESVSRSSFLHGSSALYLLPAFMSVFFQIFANKIQPRHRRAYSRRTRFTIEIQTVPS
jgi:hypothetical protein